MNAVKLCPHLSSIGDEITKKNVMHKTFICLRMVWQQQLGSIQTKNSVIFKDTVSWDPAPQNENINYPTELELVRLHDGADR